MLPDASELEWANEAFGDAPEATNLWIGGDDSVTSFHKVQPLHSKFLRCSQQNLISIMALADDYNPQSNFDSKYR